MKLDQEIKAHLVEDSTKNKLTLAQRLKCYSKVLTQRSDIHIEVSEIGKPESIAKLNNWKGKLPIEYLAFLSEMGTFHLQWGFDAEEIGGIIELIGIDTNPEWNPKPDYDEEFDYVESLMIDEMGGSESFVEYEYSEEEDKTQASIAFANNSDADRNYLGNLEEYLTDGCKNVFVWYWQAEGGQDYLMELQQKSIETDTPKEQLIAQLQTKGCTSLEAEALYQWLGEDISLLLTQ